MPAPHRRQWASPAEMDSFSVFIDFSGRFALFQFCFSARKPLGQCFQPAGRAIEMIRTGRKTGTACQP